MPEKYTKFDEEYNRLVRRILDQGFWQTNKRTGKRCLTVLGDMMKFDLSSGYFPLLTSRKLYTKGMIGELLGFIRGYDNAKDFRSVGCNFWDANANKTQGWLDNPNRKGTDDLGRIYGVQARNWQKIIPSDEGMCNACGNDQNFSAVDQLQNVVDKLNQKNDDRRLIVTHWNPGELDMQALPSCHMLYIFGIRNDQLDLCMLQRSADSGLGIPSNIASYALMLELMSKITGFKPGIFTHFLWNIHVYEDQLPFIEEQISREPLQAPILVINDKIKELKDLETWVTINDFEIKNYQHHSAINYPFSE